MKKTSNELLQFFGVKVKDKVKVDGYYYPFVIVEENGKIFAKRENCLSSWDYYDIGKLTNVLLKNEYEVVKPKKKVGEIKCRDVICITCPFHLICRGHEPNKTLNEIFETHRKNLMDIKKELNFIKVELDRNMNE